MAIFMLKPINPDAREWKASHHKGDLVVRAPNTERARWAAANVTKQASNKGLSESIPVSPWLDEALVSVTRLSGSDNDDGTVEILEPADVAGGLYRAP